VREEVKEILIVEFEGVHKKNILLSRTFLFWKNITSIISFLIIIFFILKNF